MARIIVLIKDIPDLNEVKIDPSSRRPLIEAAKRRLNDLDRRALETAIKLKEATGSEVFSLSVGDDRTKTSILEALAMGADAAYVVNEPGLRELDAQATSKALAAALNMIGGYDLIIAGELSLDKMGAQVGPRVAELLGLPQITYAKQLGFDQEKIRAVRDLEDSDELVEADPPVLVTVVREINEPRIPSLMNIMKAKKKPITEWNIATLGLTLDNLKKSCKVEVIEAKAPEVKRKRIIVKAETIEKSVAKLVSALVQEGVIE